MKVGFLTERLLLGYGVDLVVHQYATLLKARGYDATVFCLRNDDSAERRYDVVNLLEIHGGADIALIDIPRYAAHLNGLDIDIWIVNTPIFYDFMPFLARPVIAIEYGTPPSEHFAPEAARILDTAVQYRFRQVYPHLRPEDRIVCISRSIQDWLPAGVRPLSEIVYLGCDHYGRADHAAASVFRQHLGLGDGPAVLWVGRIEIANDAQPYKGFPAFIEMARQAKREEPDLQFVVVGRGGNEEAEFLRGERLAHRLNLPGAEMGAAFAACDLFVSTSLWEGFNLPLLEAQFQGTPVLAHRLGPHPEVVRDGETGMLATSPEDMLASLLSILRDPDRRARLAAGTEGFASEFSWATSVSRLEAIIERSLTNASSRPARTSGWFTRKTFPVEYTYRRFGLGTLVERVSSFLARRIGLLRPVSRPN